MSPRSRRSSTQGDEIDHEVEARLDRSFITPFDREDIHDLVSQLDDVLDGIQEVAETFVIYDVKQPDRRRPAPGRDPRGPGAAARRGHREARGAQGHRAPRAPIHELENQADGLSRAAVGAAVPGRDRGDRGHQVARRLHGLENTIDAAEDAAEVIERIVAKNA